MEYVDGYNVRALNVFINEKGIIIGGLIGLTYWNWLYIDSLWVDIKHRGKGIGTKILETAEQEARLRGCIGIYSQRFYDYSAPIAHNTAYPTLRGTSRAMCRRPSDQ